MTNASKIIAKGAEAEIIKENKSIVKNRVSKNYRIKEIDDSLRIKRTKSEAKFLEKLKGIAPNIEGVSKSAIKMQFIEGNVIKNILDNNLHLAKEIGEVISKMHDMNIIHGDLTTSNMMLDENQKVRLIDFGLSFVSEKIEDKAVDLHLFLQALESKHYINEKIIWQNFLKGYNPKKKEEILNRLEIVELRGRNKQKY